IDKALFPTSALCLWEWPCVAIGAHNAPTPPSNAINDLVSRIHATSAYAQCSDCSAPLTRHKRNNEKAPCSEQTHTPTLQRIILMKIRSCPPPPCTSSTSPTTAG